MKDLFSFIQQVVYGTIMCPVCDEKFVDNNFGVSKHAVSVPLTNAPRAARTSHETCGQCGNWNGEDIEDIKAGNIFEL